VDECLSRRRAADSAPLGTRVAVVEAEQRTAPPRDDAGLRTRWHLAVAACALDVVEHVSA